MVPRPANSVLYLAYDFNAKLFNYDGVKPSTRWIKAFVKGLLGLFLIVWYCVKFHSYSDTDP